MIIELKINFVVEPYMMQGTVNSNDVNIRPQPFVKGTVPLTTFNKGMKVSITGKVKTDGVPSDWYEIDLEGQPPAYIAREYVIENPQVIQNALTAANTVDTILPVRWFSQVDTGKFEACGPTSVLMLLQAYGRGAVKTLAGMKTFVKIDNVTSPGELIVAAQDAGPLELDFDHIAASDMTNRLVGYLSERKPVILLIDYCKLKEKPFRPPRYLKPGSTSVNHWWVVIGTDGDNFVVNDPLWRSDDNAGNGGKELRISREDLEGACAGLILVPTDSLP